MDIYTWFTQLVSSGVSALLSTTNLSGQTLGQLLAMVVNVVILIFMMVSYPFLLLITYGYADISQVYAIFAGFINLIIGFPNFIYYLIQLFTVLWHFPPIWTLLMMLTLTLNILFIVLGWLYKMFRLIPGVG